MRIAYDARPLIEQRTGIGRYVRCSLEALLAYKEVQEMLLWSSRTIVKGGVLGADPRVREKVQRGWKGNVWLQLVLPFLLQRYKPDLFHATLFLPPFFARCPAVVNIYDLTVYRYPATMEEKNRRVLDFYNKTVKRHPEETVLWVTHGGCIRPILMMLKGIDMKRYFDFFKELKPDNTSVSIIEVDKVRGHSLQLVNCTKHL